jgi:hypothetical protein
MNALNAITPRSKGGAPIGNKNAARLSPKVKAVAALLLSDPEISVEAACERSQCSRTTFYKAERSEAYAAWLQSLARTKLRTRIVRAALHRYEGLIERGVSEYVVADLSKDALAQSGVRETVDRNHRPTGIGSITIHIGPRPGDTVRIASDILPPPAQDTEDNG